MTRNPGPWVFAGLAALALVLGGSANGWQWTQRASTIKTIRELKGNLRDEKKIAQQLETSNAKLTDSELQLKHLEAGVPDVAYVPTLLTELETIGRDCGLQITGVRPKEEKKAPKNDSKKEGKQPKKAYQELLVEVKGTGLFRSVRTFVTALERFPKIVGIHSLGLSPKKMTGPGANPDELEMVVELKTYLFPEKAAERTKTARHEGTQGDPS